MRAIATGVVVVWERSRPISADRCHLAWLVTRSSYTRPGSREFANEHTPIFAGQIFSYPVRRTWEFTSEHPIRSVFPLWPVYGLPMQLLRWLWIGNGQDGEIPPIAVFWTLRVLMFLISFVLEDWALHELIPSPRHRRVAVILVASSYVTWTYQTHTFSNSVETLVVAWSLVLIQRIVDVRVSHTFFQISYCLRHNIVRPIADLSFFDSNNLPFCLQRCWEYSPFSECSTASPFQPFC